jgi:hypothetical protein
MPHFYKTVLRGTAGSQEINNILYYAPLIPTDLAFDEQDASDLADAVGAAWMDELGTLLPTSYTLDSVDTSMVDEDGITVSDFVVSRDINVSGTNANVTEGFGAVAIAKFNCYTVAEASPHPVPRRSYLAVGPLNSTDTATNFALSTQANWQLAVSNAVTGNHLIGITPMYPYRVGRTKGASLAGVGRVASVTVRPFASFRRSRLQSPTGN